MLVDEEGLGEQLSLFADPEAERRRQKQERLERAMDGIRGRYGKDSPALTWGMEKQEKHEKERI